jgi:hypothetical protein
MRIFAKTLNYGTLVTALVITSNFVFQDTAQRWHQIFKEVGCT